MEFADKFASSESSDNLRNRKKNNGVEGEAKEEQEERKPKNVISPVDPLNWYSGFPPHTLRNSQASFNKGFSLSPFFYLLKRLTII